MGAHLSLMAQRRRRQGVHKNDCSCWHCLQCTGQDSCQTKVRNIAHEPRKLDCCCRLEEFFAGYCSGFSVKTRRPLDHSQLFLYLLKGKESVN